MGYCIIKLQFKATNERNDMLIITLGFLLLIFICFRAFTAGNQRNLLIRQQNELLRLQRLANQAAGVVPPPIPRKVVALPNPKKARWPLLRSLAIIIVGLVGFIILALLVPADRKKEPDSKVVATATPTPILPKQRTTAEKAEIAEAWNSVQDPNVRAKAGIPATTATPTTASKPTNGFSVEDPDSDLSSLNGTAEEIMNPTSKKGETLQRLAEEDATQYFQTHKNVSHDPNNKTWMMRTGEAHALRHHLRGSAASMYGLDFFTSLDGLTSE
jgi:hypothetical protein